MKKRRMICLAALLTAALAGCGESAALEETQEVDYSMTFGNQTGQNVSKLEIRPSEEADWSEITLMEHTWKNSYEMPVTLQGQVPLVKEGWQVQMTFAGKEVAVWNDIAFGDDKTITFSIDETGTPAAEVALETEQASAAEILAEREVGEQGDATQRKNTEIF